tara:strand:+ start:29060 stop:29683 length:624 start_codon:yes stop_codon:yes gene_type:complete
MRYSDKSGITKQRRQLNGLPKFLAMTDPQRAPDAAALIVKAKPGSGVIIRHYGKRPDHKELKSLKRKVRTANITLLSSADRQALLQHPSDHLHLPERLLRTPLTDGLYFTGRRSSRNQHVTAAAHSRKAIYAAFRAGVDAVLISPVFPTLSHPGGKTLGITRFAALAFYANSLGLGVYALGGITNNVKIRRLNHTHIDGVAGIGLFT